MRSRCVRASSSSPPQVRKRKRTMATTTDDITRTQARPDQVLLTIDGQEVACERGDTVLEAAQRIGIHIPTLCYEPRLPATSACRMCILSLIHISEPTRLGMISY